MHNGLIVFFFHKVSSIYLSHDILEKSKFTRISHLTEILNVETCAYSWEVLKIYVTVFNLYLDRPYAEMMGEFAYKLLIAND